MQFVSLDYCIVLVISLVLCILQFAACKEQKKLEVSVQHKPDDCSTLAENGDEVAVHYTGFLDSGEVFDSSIQKKRDPLKFVLGQRKVIPGWEQGIEGMCVGEKRKLIIPPHLAYGAKGHPPVIPESATLTFETELMELKKGGSGGFGGFGNIEYTILQTVQFLAFPALILYIVYYLYNKYRQEAADVKPKDGRKKKRK